MPLGEGLAVFLNGRFVPLSEAKVSVLDHGLLYGDGVFEGIVAQRGVVFQLREHLERLYHSARYIDLEIPMKKEELMQKVLELLRKNGEQNYYIRVIVTRGPGDLSIDPRSCKEPTLIIIAEPIQQLAEDAEPKAVRLIISSYRRDSVDATTHEAKTLNYVNSILAKIEAIRYGYDDAIILDRQGFISECTATNIFIVKAGRISTPPFTSGILHGITRRVVMELAKKEGIEVSERAITPFEVLQADEVFMTGTRAGLVAAVEVAGRKVGEGRPGPITKRLYRRLIRAMGDPSFGVPIYEEASIAQKG
jgi:branched-chain amino acid aminotransferase